MYNFYAALSGVHAIAGTLGLLLFWLPVFSSKGGPLHRRAGRGFCRAMTVAGVTAVMMTVLLFLVPLQVRGALELDSAAAAAIVSDAHALARLLLALGLLLLVNTRQALLVLRCRQNRDELRRPLYQLLVACLALASLNLGLHASGSVLALVFAALGLGNAVAVWRYCFKAELQTGEWIVAHIGNILGAGIAAHTAFLVFGGRSLLEPWLSADLYLGLWLAPSIVGGVAIGWLRRHYSKKLGLGGGVRTAQQISSAGSSRGAAS